MNLLARSLKAILSLAVGLAVTGIYTPANAQDWADPNYRYRRPLTVTNSLSDTSLPADETHDAARVEEDQDDRLVPDGDRSGSPEGVVLTGPTAALHHVPEVVCERIVPDDRPVRADDLLRAIKVEHASR